MRRWRLAAGIATAGAAAVVLAVALTRSSSPPPLPAPLDDTFAGRATTRPEGLAPILRVGGAGADRAYLRFDLRDRAAVKRAVLRVTVVRGSARGLVVRRVGAGTWGECVTTRSDAPPLEGPAVRAAVAPGTGTREIDVTRLVAPGAVVGLALSAAPGADVEIASRERGASGPQLEVTGARGAPSGAPPAGLPGPGAAAVVRPPQSRFGIASGSAIEYEGRAGQDRWLDELSELGAGWVRIDVQWSLVQARGPDDDDWSRSDRLIRGALARGLQVVAMIGYTPSWALPAGVGTDKSPPADPSAFARFAAQAVRHYAPLGVHRWEIWNEPNLAGFWGPRADPAGYARLVVPAAAAIRAQDPRAAVILGGLAPAASNGTDMDPVAFLQGVYAAGAKCSFDAVGFHPYAYPRLPTALGPHNAWRQMAQTTPSLRGVMTANGDERKQIWATEFGAPTAGTVTERVDPERQAEILRLGYRLFSTEPWMGPLFWYTLADFGPGTEREDSFGLVLADGARTPSWDAYREAVAASRR